MLPATCTTERYDHGRARAGNARAPAMVVTSDDNGRKGNDHGKTRANASPARASPAEVCRASYRPYRFGWSLRKSRTDCRAHPARQCCGHPMAAMAAKGCEMSAGTTWQVVNDPDDGARWSPDYGWNLVGKSPYHRRPTAPARRQPYRGYGRAWLWAGLFASPGTIALVLYLAGILHN